MNKLTLLTVFIVVVSLNACLPEQAATGQSSGQATQEQASKTATSAPAIQLTKLPARLSYPELSSLLAQPDNSILLLDVRTLEEYNQGFIDGALLAPYDLLESSFAESDKNRPIVLYCRSGNRSSIAKLSLEKLGYTNISDFGGINRWLGPLSRP